MCGVVHFTIFLTSMLYLLVPVFLLLSLVILLHFKWKVPKGFPPGPLLPMPILCNLPFTRYWGMNRLAVFEDLRVRYGDLFSVHLGHRRVVMMTRLEQAQEVFAKKINLRPEEIVNNWRDKRYSMGDIISQIAFLNDYAQTGTE